MNIFRLTLAIALVSFHSSAFAYIDPNTGGFLFQMLAPLVAIFMSVWMFFSNQVKAVWHRIRKVFNRNAGEDKCEK